MEKYKITKISMDKYKLEYKDKVIEFNSKVEYANDTQNIIKTARLRMVADLTSKGISVKDLVKEEKKDGKTLYDNSNKEYIEEAYINEVQEEILSEIIKKMMGKTFEELVLDIGLENENEIIKLGEDLGKVISNQYAPSGEEENK